FDQRVARLDFTPGFCLTNHGDGRPVLDGARRIVAFHFGQDDVAARPPGVARQALQAYQGGRADDVFDGGIGFHAQNHTPASPLRALSERAYRAKISNFFPVPLRRRPIGRRSDRTPAWLPPSWVQYL